MHWRGPCRSTSSSAVPAMSRFVNQSSAAWPLYVTRRGLPRHDSKYEWVAANMTNTLLGFAIIAVGAFLAWLYRQWARADADSLKKMSEREFQKSQPNRKAGAARVAGSGLGPRQAQ